MPQASGKCGAVVSTAARMRPFTNSSAPGNSTGRLVHQEFALDRAWARAIARAGILTQQESEQIVAALDALEARAKSDAAWLDASKAEDVHHFVETALIEKLGALGEKLHTGRSRNDMVSTEFRMYVKDAAREIRRAIASLERAIVTQAEGNLKVPMPGNTHMQHAQPLLLSHWLLAHGEAFHRDAERVAAAAARADVCPLGSGALSGCAFPLDRKALAADLGFSTYFCKQLGRGQRPRLRPRVSVRAVHFGHASLAACGRFCLVRFTRIRVCRVAR